MTIPKEAVDAAAEAMSGVDTFDLRALATDILEAAAPHMLAGDGENRPGWDDRKTLAGIWQGHAMLPVEGLSEGVYEALIEVAAWGYQRRMDEEL